MPITLATAPSQQGDTAVHDLQTVDNVLRCNSLSSTGASLIVREEHRLEVIADLPRALEKLILYAVPSLRELSWLPESLRVLDVKGVGRWTALPILPPSLRELVVMRCPGIERFPELPPQLESLVVADLPLTAIFNVPRGLRSVCFHLCPALRLTPRQLGQLDLLSARELAGEVGLSVRGFETVKANSLSLLEPVDLPTAVQLIYQLADRANDFASVAHHSALEIAGRPTDRDPEQSAVQNGYRNLRPDRGNAVTR
jgi:hypothetical protein